ncbi:hypothetical protein LOKO_01688 [Halomonas chromatireducens]|uniref:Uncharacterized protein n=1 Tax=Halomonas chromatireducens TaxID=507626 RepID=A0A120JVZ9_9GAMM|nr:hypothetical protein LOKO_01688 [Halomonas chromatireducens]
MESGKHLYFQLPVVRCAGGTSKRRSYAMGGVGSVQGCIHSASLQTCRRCSPERVKLRALESFSAGAH